MILAKAYHLEKGMKKVTADGPSLWCSSYTNHLGLPHFEAREGPWYQPKDPA